MKHTMSLRIYYQDTDAGGIVYHSKYLDFAERARSELLIEAGLSNTCLIEQGVAFVLHRAEVEYKKPAKLDDVLTIETSVVEVKNASMIMEQRFLHSGTELVVVRIQLAFVHPKTMRPIRIPTEVKNLFEMYS